MEHLSLNEGPPPGLGPGPPGGSIHMGGPPPPPSVPQLPPQMFTTAAQLLDLTDKKIVLVLRDGRKMFGVLRSWDQFANLFLTESFERIYTSSPTGNIFSDVVRGMFIVRGENVLMLGEIDLDKEDDIPAGWREVSESEAVSATKKDAEKRKVLERKRGKALGDVGFELEHVGEVLLG